MPLIITVGIEIALRNFAICESSIEESVEVIFRNLGWPRKLACRKKWVVAKSDPENCRAYTNGYGKTFRRCASGSF
jgi:hypothetical protein